MPTDIKTLIGANAPVGATGATGVNGATGPTGPAGSTWARKTTTYTAVNTDRIIADTSGGSWTLTLPASPLAGHYVEISDGANFATNNLTVARNGSTIEGIADNLLLNISNTTFQLIYDGTTWQLIATAGKQGATGPAGATGITGPSSSIFYYLAKTTTQSNAYPGDGDIVWNNATQTSSTNIYVSHLTEELTDIEVLLNAVIAGQKIVIQDKNNSANYQTWQVTSVTANNLNTSTAYFNYGVTLVNSGGTGSTNFSNTQQLFLYIQSGGVGATGPAFGSIALIVDGGGSVISTGVKGYLEVPFAGTITKWTVLNDISGSITFDIWKDTYANYPPTVADTITASAKPLTSSATKGQSSTLTGWTTSVASGDILAFNVDSATTVTRSTIILSITKT